MTVGRKKSFLTVKGKKKGSGSHRRLDNKERDKKRAVPDAK